jgi:hypothetical protein
MTVRAGRATVQLRLLDTEMFVPMLAMNTLALRALVAVRSAAHPVSPAGRASRWPRVVLAVWVVAALGIAVNAYLNPRGHTLFDIYATGIRCWWAGQDLYPRQPDTGEFFRYSPAFAVLTSPFGLLPPGAGNAAWKVFNAGAFALALYVWCRHALTPAPSANRTASIFFAGFFAVLGNLYNGQANLLMTALVLLGLAAVARQRWWWAAGFIAGATLIKAYPLALALVLAVLYWRTFPVRYLTAVAVGLLVPFAAQHPVYVIGQTGEWFHHITGSFDINRDRLRSLEKALECAGLGVERHAFRRVAAGAGVAVLAVGVWTARRGGAPTAVLFRVGAWFSAWVLLFTPSCENATFGVLGPFLAWAVVDAFHRPGAWASRVWLLACLYLVGLSTTDLGALTKRFFGRFPSTTTGGVLFQLWLIGELFRRHAPGSAERAREPEAEIISYRGCRPASRELPDLPPSGFDRCGLAGRDA